MFNKILIANRGEIALRVIRTCKKMGIATVAVHSEADANAPHVAAADEAYLIGPPPVSQSYLNMERILEVAQRANVDAIHPGYGLLSENPQFARKCEDMGIAFIGPSPDMIEAMGSKIFARQTMEKAGVPIVPGTLDPVHDVEEACRLAEDMGFPVMLKASAGGGGIGMQVVHSGEELTAAFASNKGRVKAYFGDDAMFIEKYIVNPRHIEVQILADQHGNTVYLGERECSIQRRHQKVVEEAPSPFLDEGTRQLLGEAAVRAAKAIGYVNAGTVEFLVDADKNFYFLEMNTRIQVEHPVTEEVFDVDIVEEQLKIASGENLTFSQSQLAPQGHAIECRIYAEDPVTFYPSPGTITELEFPTAEYIRIESGVTSGSAVTPYYDPMIAKLIVKGGTRGEAIARMNEALSHCRIAGIKTNLTMLQKVIEHPAFSAGDTTTDFVAVYLQKKDEGRQ